MISTSINSEQRKKWCQRQSHGAGLLSITALLSVILVFFCVLGFAVYVLLGQQKRNERIVEVEAMTAAKLLNQGDRIGQMNNVVARCRELVYLSRLNYENTDTDLMRMYQPLALQLLEESRKSALLVEKERQNQIKLASQIIDTHFRDLALKSEDKYLVLPFVQSRSPHIAEVSLGFISGVESNVENLQVIPILREFDLKQRYIQPGSNLYRGNINAKLPPPDDDLNFKLASLPSNVGQTVNTARLTNKEVFQRSALIVGDPKLIGKFPDQLASAIQLTGVMDVATGAGKGSISLISTSTTDGALPAP